MAQGICYHKFENSFLKAIIAFENSVYMSVSQLKKKQFFFLIIHATEFKKIPIFSLSI